MDETGGGEGERRIEVSEMYGATNDASRSEGGNDASRCERKNDASRCKRNNDASRCDDTNEVDNDAFSISIMYTNAQSLVNKIDELRVIVNINSPDVIVISEAWTNDAISDEFLNVGGYDINERRDRNDTDKGRGVGIMKNVE